MAYGFHTNNPVTYIIIAKKQVTILPLEKSERDVMIPKYKHNAANAVVSILDTFLIPLILFFKYKKQ